MRRFTTGVVILAGTAAVYAATMRFGPAFEIGNGLAVVFPLAAIGIVATMLLGGWAVGGVFAGAVLATSLTGMPLASATLLALILTTESCLPYLVFLAVRNLSPDLRDLRSFVTFVVFGTILNTLLAALTVNLLFLAPPIEDESVLLWWIVDLTASLLIATPILAFGTTYLRRSSVWDHQHSRRRIVNAIQITVVVLLLGWLASATIRNYLIDTLESERLEHQEEAYTGSELINLMHSNFLQAARLQFQYMDEPAPEIVLQFDEARKANRRYIGQLRPFVESSSLAAQSKFTKVQEITVEWFDQAYDDLSGEDADPEASGGAHSLGRVLLDLKTEMLDANGAAWRAFVEERHRIMMISYFVDVLVFIILLLAAYYLIMSISRPLVLLHRAVDAMQSRKTFEAHVIDSGFIEIQTLAEKLDETSHTLMEREEQLLRQTERALDASRHKSEFLAKMSHELRTPLNSIVGFSELLAGQHDSLESERRGRFLGNIVTSSRQLLDMIDDLLDISRIDSGRMSFEFESADLRDVIHRSVTSASSSIAGKRLELEIDLPGDPVNVWIDPRRTAQIFVNLLSNACKFTEDGGTIRIAAREEGDFYTTDVSDTGIGIPAENLQEIFDEFVQVHATGTLSGGAGLGLAIARKFVERQGGAIGVESEPGRGSTFRVSLPRRKRFAGDAGTSDDVAISNSRTDPDFREERLR